MSPGSKQFSLLALLTFLLVAWVDVGTAADSRFGQYRQPPVTLGKITPKNDTVFASDVRWQISLPAPTTDELERYEQALKQTPVQIGHARYATKLGYGDDFRTRPEWLQRADGGWSLTLEIISWDAEAIRAGLLVGSLPSGSELLFFDGGQRLIDRQAPMVRRQKARGTRTDDTSVLQWSPTVDGDTLYLEIKLAAGAEPNKADIALGPISHYLISPFDYKALSIAQKSAGACNLDVVCYSEYDQLRTAVSQMVYTDRGNSFSCTGQLLNNGDANAEQYYLSAHHCLSTQEVADTVETIWNFESAACNSPTTSPDVRTVRGGAELLTADEETDTILMRLRGEITFPVFYAGWSTSPATNELFGIHHPSSDLKKISFGEVEGYTTSDPGVFLSVTDPDASFVIASWREGVTEVGSSGSAIYDEQQRIVGTLFGGSSSCRDPDGFDFYGRFDRAYERNAWSTFLSAQAAELRRVTLAKSGTGVGLVSSTPSGIECDETCSGISAAFEQGTSLVLTASPSGNAEFTGWGESACISNPAPNQCVVNLTSDLTVTAEFTADLSAVASAISDSGEPLPLGAAGKAWIVDTSTAATGASSASSAPIGNDDNSTLITELTGPGTLEFYWRVSSERGFDFLSVSVNGRTTARISGERDWTRAQSIELGDGINTVSWRYQKDVSTARGADRGWIDDVVFTPAATEPPVVEPARESPVLELLQRIRLLLEG